MDEPSPRLAPRPCAAPHSAPIAWLRAAGQANPPDPDAIRVAIEIVLGNPEAIAEVIERAPPSALPFPAEATRHDGWTGERMARFLEVLADTGLITEASRAAGMHRDSAYALRNRDPLFAAAMRAAKAKARPLVADGLLERSITGTVEHYYRDGVLVGERRHYESWLGLAVLKRLDKQAADDRAEGSLAERIGTDWAATLDALRAGGTEAARARLDPETDKADTPPSPPGLDLAEHCWRAGSAEDPALGRESAVPEGSWLTAFPPPPGFDGYEMGSWDGFAWYERACTPEEAELIEAHAAAAEAAEQAELSADAEAERHSFFAMLRRELEAFGQPELDPVSASPQTAPEEA